MVKFPKTKATQRAATTRKPVELPPIQTLSDKDVCPSILLQGGSGCGKTYCIGRLMHHGYKVLVLAVEPKIQILMRYKPKVIFIGAPTESGDNPSTDVKYDRLMGFADALERGEFREHDGEPFDAIAIDGLLEVGDLIYAYWKRKRPRSESTGKQNTYGMWEEIADRSIEFFKRCQKAAGLVSPHLNYKPIPILATIGEQMIEGAMGEVKYIPLFPGQKAPKNLPYNFEIVLRLSNRNISGVPEWVIHTVGTEEFFAKCPGGLFESEEVNPDFGLMYQKIAKHYTITSDEEDNSNA